MTHRDGIIRIGLRCVSSHHWSGLAAYNATTDCLLLLSWPDGFCPQCGRPDSGLDRVVECHNGKRLSLRRGWVLEAPRPSLIQRTWSWLSDFTGVDPAVFGFILGIGGLLLLVVCRLVTCWVRR